MRRLLTDDQRRAEALAFSAFAFVLMLLLGLV